MEPNIEFQERIKRTVNTLTEAVGCLQRAQTYLKSAKTFGTLNGEERKILDRINLDLFEPIDRIIAVREIQRIGMK